MSLILKPKVAVTWIPNGKIVVKPVICATAIPPANIEMVFADTLRKVSKIETVEGDTLRRLKVLPATINADTLRKISRIETINGDTRRVITREGELSNSARTVKYIFGNNQFKEFQEVEVSCTIAQIEALGNICAAMFGSNLVRFRVTDEQEYQVAE